MKWQDQIFSGFLALGFIVSTWKSGFLQPLLASAIGLKAREARITICGRLMVVRFEARRTSSFKPSGQRTTRFNSRLTARQ